jgi:hypothetical protein
MSGINLSDKEVKIFELLKQYEDQRKNSGEGKNGKTATTSVLLPQVSHSNLI